MWQIWQNKTDENKSKLPLYVPFMGLLFFTINIAYWEMTTCFTKFFSYFFKCRHRPKLRYFTFLPFLCKQQVKILYVSYPSFCVEPLRKDQWFEFMLYAVENDKFMFVQFLHRFGCSGKCLDFYGYYRYCGTFA